MTYDINTIYTKYKQLTKKQRQQLLTALQSQGINIVKIEAYEYADAPGIKHLFSILQRIARKLFPTSCQITIFGNKSNYTLYKLLNRMISVVP